MPERRNQTPRRSTRVRSDVTVLKCVSLDPAHRERRTGVFTQPRGRADVIAVRVRHDVFSNTAPVQEPGQTPPRPGKSSINHDVAVSPVDHHGVEQPAGEQRAGMNPVNNGAELGRHGCTQS